VTQVEDDLLKWEPTAVMKQEDLQESEGPLRSTHDRVRPCDRGWLLEEAMRLSEEKRACGD
jgi:hypothetical protein